MTRRAGEEDDVVVFQQLLHVTVEEVDVALGVLGLPQRSQLVFFMDDTMYDLQFVTVKSGTADITAHFKDFFGEGGKHSAGRTLAANSIVAHSSINFRLEGIAQCCVDGRTGADTLFAVDALLFVNVRHDKAIAVFLHGDGILGADVHTR